MDAAEGFHDYTLATQLERLVAQLEQCFRGWMLTGLENISHLPPALGPDKQPINLVRVATSIKHRMPWREQPYILTLHVPYTREADLQAARQRQQAAQQAARQQQQQQQQQAAAVAVPKQPRQGGAGAAQQLERGAPAAPAAAAGAAAAAAVAATQRALADHVAAAAAGSPGAVAKLQEQLAPLLSGGALNGSGSSSANGANGAGNEQLQQRVDDLIAQYHLLHLQLQQEQEQGQGQEQQAQGSSTHEQQQQQQQQRGEAAAPPEAGDGATQQQAPAAAAAAAVEHSSGSGSGAKAIAAAAAAAVDALAGLGLASLGAGSSGAAAGASARTAAAGGAAAARAKPPKAGKLGAVKKQAGPLRSGAEAPGSEEGEEGDEATAREVELPAAEQLVAPNSSALAAAHAAVRQDQSRTAASRTWWPLCYCSGAGGPLAAQQQLTRGAAARAGARPHQALPCLRPAWWAPGSGTHKLQRWFGLDLFVLLQPASYSRRLLDAAEASSLLSVVRLALTSSCVVWPLLLPVHDALRDAYRGVAQVGALSVYFTTDSIHISRLPRHLAAPEQQLALLAEQLVPHNPSAAIACLAVLGQHADATVLAALGSTGVPAGQHCEPQPGSSHAVWLSACATFRLPDASKRHWLQHALSSGCSRPPAQQQQDQGQPQRPAGGGPFGEAAQQPQPQLLLPPPPAPADEDELDGLDWDADTPWHPWAQQRDPIHVLELDAVWQDARLLPPDAATSPGRPAAAAPGAAAARGGGGALSPAAMACLLDDVASADHWLLHVLTHGFSSAPARPGRLGVRSVERHRRHVALAVQAGADWLWSAEAAQQVLACGGRLSGVCPQPWGAPPPRASSAASAAGGPQLDPGSFTTMLSALMTARTAAAAAHSLWELAGADWWEARGEPSIPPHPPDSVLDSVLRDLLSPPRPAAFGAGASSGSGSASGLGSRRSSRELPSGSAAGASGLSRASSGTSGSAAGAVWQQQLQLQQLEGAASKLAEAAQQAGPAPAAAAALPRTAPPGSLLCRLALHALLFGNARAVAALWQRFMVQVRLHFWEQRTLLPYLPAGQHSAAGAGGSAGGGSAGGRRTSFQGGAPGAGLACAAGGPPAPDLDSCLLHQKLQMLNVCIWRRDKRLARGVAGKQQQHSRGGAPAGAPSNGGSASRPGSAMALSSPGARAPAPGEARSHSRHASGASSSSSTGPDEAGGDAPAGSASARSGSGAALTATSSAFFSVADPDEAEALPSGAAGEGGGEQEASSPLAPAAQPDQQQQQECVFEDATSELDSSGNGNGNCGGMAPEPAGVAAVLPGQFLLRHPERPLRVPIVQDDPVVTEDQLIQRQAALLRLASDPGGGAGGQDSAAVAGERLLLKQRLLAAPLLADMEAFKAANPGCCLEDFLRWYSPKDWVQPEPQPEPTQQQQQQQQQQPAAQLGQREQQHVQPARGAGDCSASTPQPPAVDAPQAQAAGEVPVSGGQLSARMAAGAGNEWQQLWSLAEPQPAAAQRPLLNPQKEGELVLHYLETLSPAALFSQLLAAAVAEATSLLAASRGAALPAAAAVVERFCGMASGVLRKGGGMAEALQAAAAATAGPPGREQAASAGRHELAGDWQGAEDGLSDVELELLLAEFAYAEQVVVLAESLLHHLPGQTALAGRLLQHLLHGCGSSGASGGEGAAAAAAAECDVLGTRGLLPVAALAPEERLALLRWVAACAAASETPAGRGRGSRRHAPHQQHCEHSSGGSGGQLHSPRSPGGSSSSAGGSGGQHSWAAFGGTPAHSDASAPAGVGDEAAQPAGSSGSEQEARQLLPSLGQPAQREWVLSCAPLPSMAAATAASSGGGATSSVGPRLKPAVAAAVAAAAGRAPDGGGGGDDAPVPPSRLYIQEADGEMRLALALVSERGRL